MAGVVARAPSIREGGHVNPFVYEALPARVVFGSGVAHTRLADEVARLDVTRVLLIASQRDEELVRTLVAPFAARVAATFTDVKEHVPVETAAAVRGLAVDVAADAVLCIGGGSTTHRGAAALLLTLAHRS